MFGNAGVEHMEKYGTTQEQLAKVAWKNHKHSKNNPYAQFREEYSMEQILKSPQVFGPLTKLQCCPTVSIITLYAQHFYRYQIMKAVFSNPLQIFNIFSTTYAIVVQRCITNLVIFQHAIQ